MMEFRELTMSDESLYCDYMSEWIDHDEQVVQQQRILLNMITLRH